MLPRTVILKAILTRVLPLTCVAAAACTDDVPVAPAQPRTVNPVVRVVVIAADQALSPGDSVRAGAQAFDAQGMVIPTASITWSSSAPAVASVDARGMVRGVAVGTAQIRATAEGQTGSLDFTVGVTELCECTRVIDSTAVELVQRDDSSGVFVFRVTGQAPTIDSGSIIVGAEDGGFLRRVHRVTRSGNVLTMNTTQAYLEEAVRDGEFATTTFSDGVSIPFDSTATRFGPWTTTYLAPGLTNVAAACCTVSLNGLGFSLKYPPQATKGAFDVKVDFTVKKGEVVFEPRIDIGARFSAFRLQSFRTIARGDVGLNLDEYEIKVTGEFSKGFSPFGLKKESKKYIVQRKPFVTFIGPMPVAGVIVKTLKLEITPTIAGSLGFTGKFRTGFGVTAGMQWSRSGGWTPVSGSSSYFEATAPALSGIEGSLTLKIAPLVAEYSVLMYGVAGPFINIEPYAEGAATAALSADGRLVNGSLGITGLDWETKVSLGLNLNIGAKFSVAGAVDLAEAAFQIPLFRPYRIARAYSDGPLAVRTSVKGADQPDSLAIRLRPTFNDDYELGFGGALSRIVDGTPPFGRDLATSSQDRWVMPNDSIVLQDVRSGTSFKHTVGLHDLPGNCASDQPMPDTVAVRSGAFLGAPEFISGNAKPSSDTLEITCIPMGALRVRTVVSGEDPIARSQLTLTRMDKVGAGKGTPPLTMGIPSGTSPPDTIVDKLAPANPALGTNGRHTVAIDPGRRNCAVAKPATHSTTITSGDTAFTEFRLTCVALGHVLVRTQTTDPDSASPTETVTYNPNVTASDTADRVSTQPGTVGATSSRALSGLIPVYNASGASGRHHVSLTGMPNRCTHVAQSVQSVTVFPGDTAIAPFVLRCVERLHVATRSTGIGSDRDGYFVLVEDADGSVDSIAIGVNDTLGIAGVTPGARRITLADVDPNCNAPASATRNVSGRDSTLVSFTVHCPGPPAPTGLRATQILTHQIDLAWDPPPPGRRVGHYRLYRTTAVPATTVVIDSIPSLIYSDAGLTPSTLYHYQVSAVDTDGVVGPRSNVLRVRTLDGTPPTTPANLTAAAVSASRINVSWSAASDPQSGISRYRIYRNGALIDSTAGTSYANTGLTPSTTYSYYVVAVNGQGLTGSQSNTATATTLDGSPPTAPSGLSATAISMSRIDLVWAAATDPQSGIQHYKVYRNGVVVGTSTTLAFSDQGLTPNTTYGYVVTAVNGAGLEGPPSQPATATTLPDQTPPSAPSGLSATAISSTQINLAWGAATDPESGIALYRIYRGGTLIGTSATTTFSDAGLTPSTMYTYEVSGVNGAGLEGPRAGPATATTKAPPQPSTGDLAANVSSRGSGIPAGYQVQVSGSGVLITQPVAANGSLTFAGLVPQTYTVVLQNVPANCTVDGAGSSRTVVVSSGATASTTFQVRCN